MEVSQGLSDAGIPYYLGKNLIVDKQHHIQEVDGEHSALAEEMAVKQAAELSYSTFLKNKLHLLTNTHSLLQEHLVAYQAQVRGNMKSTGTAPNVDNMFKEFFIDIIIQKINEISEYRKSLKGSASKSRIGLVERKTEKQKSDYLPIIEKAVKPLVTELKGSDWISFQIKLNKSMATTKNQGIDRIHALIQDMQVVDYVVALQAVQAPVPAAA
eukprot:Filipodium_phascolosomae@DN6437_c0_g1_i1.p1